MFSASSRLRVPRRSFFASNRHDRAGSGSRADLSERELEVIRFVSQGLSNKEIATRLELSIKSVETYRARAAEKIGAKSRAEIVRFGVGQGWLKEL